MKKLLSLLIATVLIFSLSACQLLPTDSDKDTPPTTFVKPENFKSVLQVIINPTLNLYLDGEGTILAVEYVNTDASDTYRAVEKEIVGKTVEDGIDVVVETAVEKGYLNDGQTMTLNVLEATGLDALEVLLNKVVPAAGDALIEKAPEALLGVQNEGVELAKPAKPTQSANKDETIATNATKLPQTDEDERFDDDEDKDAASNNNPPIANAPDNSDDETDKTVSTNVNMDDPVRPTTPTNDRLPEKDEDPVREPQIVEGKPYCYYQPKENGVLQLSLTFDFAEGVCAFSELSYGKEDFGMGSIEYEGETYYEDGGLGDALDFTYEGHKLIIVDGDKRLILGPDANGTTLFVQTADPINFFESFTLKPGTRLTVR